MDEREEIRTLLTTIEGSVQRVAALNATLVAASAPRSDAGQHLRLSQKWIGRVIEDVADLLEFC